MKSHTRAKPAPTCTLRRRSITLAAALTVLMLAPLSCAHSQHPPSSTDGDPAPLRTWWAHYKKTFIEPSGRVSRPRDQGDTVSEGQAYALLYSVLLDDRETFDRVLRWTQSNLSRKAREGDSLLAWRWRDGRVLDWNSASDADLDYAHALLLAHRRWRDFAYLAEAQRLERDILKKETTKVAAWGALLLPGTWGATPDDGWVLNPSYFSPAAFRILHEISGDPQWRRLTKTSYRLWKKSGARLGKVRGKALPPDWCGLDPRGRLRPVPDRSTAYGWEAVRLPMRAGMDALLSDSSQARRLLRRGPVRFFRARFRKGDSHVAAVYAYDGDIADPSPSLAMTAMVLFAFQAADQQPPDNLVRSFEQQLAADDSRDDYYGRSLAFYPLAFRARIFRRPWLGQ